MEKSAIEVLREFVSDVEAVGVLQTARDWPDIVITYRKAKAVLQPESEPANVYSRRPHRSA
jgi:hypothetical protein